MIVKGIELIKMIADGKVNQHTRVSVDNYNDCSLDFVFKDGRNIFKWLDEDFEILEDKTEEIEEIKEIEYYEINGVGDEHDQYVLSDNQKYICGAYNDPELVTIRKINELVRTVNKLNEPINTSKETNCMSD